MAWGFPDYGLEVLDEMGLIEVLAVKGKVQIIR